MFISVEMMFVYIHTYSYTYIHTCTGGDGFFVLDDLYGSDGLIFCPEIEPINPGSLPTKPSVEGESFYHDHYDHHHYVYLIVHVCVYTNDNIRYECNCCYP